MSVLDSSPKDGATIRDLAEGLLRRHPHLALQRVHCEYHDGVLTLRGCLPSYYLKQLAQEALARVEGVKRIDNRIEVVAASRA